MFRVQGLGLPGRFWVQRFRQKLYLTPLEDDDLNTLKAFLSGVSVMRRIKLFSNLHLVP